MERKIKSVLNSLRWFECSGIMRPADGFWGVAERLVTWDVEDEVKEEILKHFTSRTLLKDCFVVESRRPDCNFQTALLFLLNGKLLENETAANTGRNLLDYLFFRSGMKRSGTFKLPHAWRWSHITCGDGGHWFDDNSWCIILECAIRASFPELDAQYHAGICADALSAPLCPALERTLEAAPNEKGERFDPEKLWLGDVHLPHWGALPVFALSCVHASRNRPDYLPVIRKYLAYLKEELPGFSTSEYAYALMGATAAEAAFGDALAAEVARMSCECLCAAADPDSGTLPSGHYEAPVGKERVDLIYTMNWSVLALQMYCRLHPRRIKAKSLLRKQLDLLISIQDTSQSLRFFGCWRGMYDLASHSWGGGNRYEGGASSIYSGWTNAPIALAILMDAFHLSLLDVTGIR